MATISDLRGKLRGAIDDIQKLDVTARLTNEFLNEKLFNSLQLHNEKYTWQTLPVDEEQLVLLLAKSQLASDLALRYAISTRVTVSPSVRSTIENSSELRQISQDLREEYRWTRNMISSQSSSGDVVEGIMVRHSPTTRSRVPQQGAVKPAKMRLGGATYQFNPLLGTGRVYWTWTQPRDYDLAFIRLAVSRRSPVTYEDTIIHTLYDVYIDPLAIPPVPPISEEEGYVDYTFLPTGRWYLAMIPVNWNRLWSVSDACPLDVENYISCRADAAVVQP
jgi:hypothetical protein